VIISTEKKESEMEGFTDIIKEVMPALVAGAGLLWSFSKQVTQIEAKLQALQHQLDDCKHLIEGNRQGRIEVFGVINNQLKPKDNDASERLARVETTIQAGITPSEVYTRLAKIEAELESKKADS